MTEAIREFHKILYDYYAAHKRDLPWRHTETDGTFDAYKILVSEMMLQQTQVNRVVPKYGEFLEAFPAIGSLAGASLGQVLKLWNGLGYNRRAKFLHDTAKQIVERHSGVIPKTLNKLTELPGIGQNTAAAICVYAYDQPQIFIETNIRTVYIHHFFQSVSIIDDTDITPLIESTLQGQDPREFYWALMDYGTHLKATEGNESTRSKHYAKQSAFTGSRRQIRGQILKLLLDGPKDRQQLYDAIVDERVAEVLQDLENEHLILRTNDSYAVGS